MNPAGQLHIHLHWQGGKVRSAELSSSRPFHALRLFNGKTPDQLLSMVPLLFNVCGVAQGHAALEACRQALAMPPDSASRHGRRMLTLLETAREHGWRILSDWPGFAGVTTEKPQWARLSSLIAEFKSALFRDGDAFSLNATPYIDPVRLQHGISELEALLDEQIFAGRLREWQGIEDQCGLDAWLTDNPSIPAQLFQRLIADGTASAGLCPSAWLPALADAELHRILSGPQADEFIAAPVWHGQTCETGALNRQRHHPLINSLLHEYGNGLVTRLAACLSELADIPPRLRQCLNELNDNSTVIPDSNGLAENGCGLAQVEAARGLLIHRLVLAQGRIAGYQIVAPTEWNCHPAGVAVRALSGLRAENEASLRRQAAMLISAIDPCVGYRLTIAPNSDKMRTMVTEGKGHA